MPPIGLRTWGARGQGDSRGEKGAEGPGGVDGDFSAPLTFAQKESGHPGRREKPGSIPQFSQIIVSVTVGTSDLQAEGSHC